jgi:hypothetical protein
MTNSLCFVWFSIQFTKFDYIRGGFGIRFASLPTHLWRSRATDNGAELRGMLHSVEGQIYAKTEQSANTWNHQLFWSKSRWLLHARKLQSRETSATRAPNNDL